MNREKVAASPQSKLPQIGTELLETRACGSEPLVFEGFRG